MYIISHYFVSNYNILSRKPIVLCLNADVTLDLICMSSRTECDKIVLKWVGDPRVCSLQKEKIRCSISHRNIFLWRTPQAPDNHHVGMVTEARVNNINSSPDALV